MSVGGSRRCGGITLIEALVVVALVAILATIAVPSFRDMSMNNNLYSRSLELMTALRAVQSEARKSDQRSATLCAKDGDWRKGWQALTGNNCNLDAGERELLNAAEQSGLDKIKAPGTAVTFNRDGTTPNVGLFSFCDSRGVTKAKGVEVTQSGIIRSTSTDLNCS